MKMNRRTVMTSLAPLTAAAALSPLQASAQDKKSTLLQVQERGVLLAGVRYDYPPGSYMNAKGEVTGYGPDVARAFAKHLGVDIKFVQTTSQTRIPLLLNGQIDAGFGPTTNSKVRDEVIDFSLTWATERAVMVVKAGASRKQEDYIGNKKRIGVTQGSVYVGYWKEKDKDANFKTFQLYPDLLTALIQDHVDVALLDAQQAEIMLKQIGDGKLEVGDQFYEDTSSIIVRENDSAWRDWINWGLQRMWAEGTLQELYLKHFKEEPSFVLWQPGVLQPGVLAVHGDGDKW